MPEVIHPKELSDPGDLVPSLWSSGQLKRYHILGNVSDFEEELAAVNTGIPEQALEEEPILVDEDDLPDSIRHVLHISPGSKEAILSAYKQLMSDRKMLQSHLVTLNSRKGMDQPSEGSWYTKTISQEIKIGQEGRALEKWNMQQQEWTEISQHLATVTGRPEQDLAMFRGEEWRQREEMLEHLLKSIPLNKRGHGAEQWRMSLRNAWERWVPVGSIFSGLFAAVYDKPSVKDTRELLKVGKHGEVCMTTTTQDAQSVKMPSTGLNTMSRSLKARQRSWADSKWLNHQTTVYNRHMKDLQPHDPDMNRLIVTGEAIEHKIWDMIHREATLEDILRLLGQREPEVAEEIKGDLLQHSGETMSEEIVPVEEEITTMEDGKKSYRGPRLELMQQSLMFHSQPGVLSECVLKVSNTGSTAVYYEWEPKKLCLPEPATGGPKEMRFFLFDRRGSILPGHHKDFRIVFRSSQPGRFVEQWVLHTTPFAFDTQPLIALHGFVTLYDTSVLQRKQFNKMLQNREKMRKVNSAVERIVRDIQSQPQKPLSIDAETNMKRIMFNGANVERLPPLYFEHDCFQEMASMYTTVVGKLYPPLVDDDKPAKGGKGGKGNKKAPQPEVVSPPPPPEDWDGSIEALNGLINNLEDQFPEDATQMRSRLESVPSKMRTPMEELDIITRAVRLVVLKCCTAMESRAESVMEECVERFSKSADSNQEEGTEAIDGDSLNYDPEEYSQELKVASKEAIAQNLLIEEQITHEKHLVAEYLKDLADEARNTLEKDANLSKEEEQNLTWTTFYFLRKMNRLGLTDPDH